MLHLSPDSRVTDLAQQPGAASSNCHYHDAKTDAMSQRIVLLEMCNGDPNCGEKKGESNEQLNAGFGPNSEEGV
jgi:hypothetical protein